MKTSRFVSKSQPIQFIVLLLTVAAFMMNPLRSSAAVIVNVVETGGDNEATDTITAKWTGATFNTTIANEPKSVCLTMQKYNKDAATWPLRFLPS